MAGDSYRLNAHERGPAQLLAMRLIIRCVPDPEIILALRDTWKQLSAKTAQAIIDEAWQMLSAGQDPKSLAQRKHEARLRCQELWRLSLEAGNLPAALGVTKHWAHLDGLLKRQGDPEPDEIPTTGEAVGEGDEEFEGRSVTDLEFFNRHGMFPEEYKPPAKRPRSNDPLALLDAPKGKKRKKGGDLN